MKHAHWFGRVCQVFYQVDRRNIRLSRVGISSDNLIGRLYSSFVTVPDVKINKIWLIMFVPWGGD